jgi:hypothetical protein
MSTHMTPMTDEQSEQIDQLAAAVLAALHGNAGDLDPRWQLTALIRALGTKTISSKANLSDVIRWFKMSVILAEDREMEVNAASPEALRLARQRRTIERCGEPSRNFSVVGQVDTSDDDGPDESDTEGQSR